MRMLWRLKTRNQRWRIYDHFLVGENRWRAQRYGVTEGLIDFGRGAVVPFEELVEAAVADDGLAILLSHTSSVGLPCVIEPSCAVFSFAASAKR